MIDRALKSAESRDQAKRMDSIAQAALEAACFAEARTAESIEADRRDS